jgi:hypothetical protein
MRKLRFIIGLLCALSLSLPWAPSRAENIVGPPNAIYCNITANTAITTGTIQLIAGVANKIINICGYVFSGSTAGTVQFEFGTGATCTTPTLLTALFTTATGVSLTDHFSYAFASSKPGESLCVVITANASAAAYVSQF